MCFLEIRSALSDFTRDRKSFLPNAPASPEMGIQPPADAMNFGPGPVAAGVVCAVSPATRVSVVQDRYPACVPAWPPARDKAGLLVKSITATVAAMASSAINRIYSSHELVDVLSPLNPRAKMLLWPESDTVAALAISVPLLMPNAEMDGATVTVVVALTLPSTLVAVSV